ncbi:MAG: DUF2059 domain-containing protein [Acidobacteriota bacterium]
MKRWMAGLTVTLMVVLAVAPGKARADEASKEAKVKELFAVMHMERNLDEMMQSMRIQVKMVAENGEGSQPMTPARKTTEQNFINNALKVVNQSFSWPVLEPAYIKLYMGTYTESELDGMLAFYKSPAGQAMLNNDSHLKAGVMQIVHSHMGDFESKMQALQQQYKQKMGH